MNKMDSLVEAIKSHELVMKAQKLKEIIENDSKLLEDFKNIQAIQKQLVQLEYAKSPKQISLKKQYEMAMNGLLETVAVSEYLAVIEELNDLIQTLTKIIIDPINP